MRMKEMTMLRSHRGSGAPLGDLALRSRDGASPLTDSGFVPVIGLVWTSSPIIREPHDAGTIFHSVYVSATLFTKIDDSVA